MIPKIVCFLLGSCVLCLFQELPSLITSFITASTLIFLSIFSGIRKYKIHWLAAFALGFFWLHIAAERHLITAFPKGLEGEQITVVGTILSLPESQNFDEGENQITAHQWQNFNDSIRFEFSVQKAIPEHLWPKPGRIRLRLENPPSHIRVGDQWQFVVKLKRPHGYANPGSYDKERNFFLNRWAAEGTVVSKEPKVLIKRETGFYFRMRIHDAIFQYLNQSKYAGILSALVVGSKDGVSQEQWALFRDTGTAHLMAISGLHIGLVSGFIFACVIFIFRFLPYFCFYVPARIYAAAFSMIGATIYALLAGFSIPTQRSLIMIFVFMLSIIFKQTSCPWHNYFLALALVLLWDPFAVLSPGFWLSFGAVGVILFGMKNRSRPTGLWWRFGRTQWVVFLGLIPISLAIFQQTSIVAPLANIVAIPVVSFFTVPFAILGGICLPAFPKMGIFFLSCGEAALKILWPFLEFCCRLPRAVFMQASLSLHAIIIATFGVLLLILPHGVPARRLGFVVLLPLFFNHVEPIENESFCFTMLDVGQGLAAIVETKHHVLVFDTGPKLNPNFDTGDRVVMPFLATKNRSKIDAIIISHGDNDHIGGLKSILQKMPVAYILTSEPKIVPNFEPNTESETALIKSGTAPNKNSHTNVEQCYAGQKWIWDGVEFEILHPSALDIENRNDRSCVLRVSNKHHSVLLTGDIETPSEKILLQRNYTKLKADILLVPHHGSRTSSSKEFIQAVQPTYALFPVGYKNSYGHPKPDIVDRYKKHGAILMDSVNDGAVTFKIPNNLTKLPLPERYRIDHAKFWFNKTE